MAFLMGFIDLSEISWDLAKLVEFAEWKSWFMVYWTSCYGLETNKHHWGAAAFSPFFRWNMEQWPCWMSEKQIVNHGEYLWISRNHMVIWRDNACSWGLGEAISFSKNPPIFWVKPVLDDTLW
jgi:hypothetical protein